MCRLLYVTIIQCANRFVNTAFLGYKTLKYRQNMPLVVVKRQKNHNILCILPFCCTIAARFLKKIFYLKIFGCQILHFSRLEYRKIAFTACHKQNMPRPSKNPRLYRRPRLRHFLHTFFSLVFLCFAPLLRSSPYPHSVFFVRALIFSTLRPVSPLVAPACFSMLRATNICAQNLSLSPLIDSARKR